MGWGESLTLFTNLFRRVVFSSQPVEVVQLEESRNVVLAGKWSTADKTCGGCHLFDKAFQEKEDKCTWSQNPQFILKLNTQELTNVKITLSRPDKVWKKQVGLNLVGSMIGFYVYPANEQPDKDKILNREGTKLIPWNEINEELELDGSPDGYIIMPATYEPEIQGPFVLSVSTDVEFTLTQQIF